MARIATLLHKSGTQQLLADWIRKHTDHEPVLRDDGDEMCETEFDLCILDGYTFEEYADVLAATKSDAAPIFLPYLLLIERRYATQLDADVWDRIDGIVWHSPSALSGGDTEAFQVELQGRIENLVRQRELSLDLDRRRNLSLVLNRVLRHNLRNDMTVVRGRLQMVFDELDRDDGSADIITRNIDQLIDIGEKARQLERVIESEPSPGKVELMDTLAEIAADVTTEFPAASISIDGPDEVQITAESFVRTALFEVIENAAKHSGDEPTIKVAVTSDENTVNVRITDDGPGLPEQERAVLTGREESSLSHGSGLGHWLVYWIVNYHDGTIETTVDGATTITISIPYVGTDTPSDPVELERAQGRYEAMFEKVSDAILFFNDENRILDANHRAAELFGVGQRELLGRSISEFASDDVTVDTLSMEFGDDGATDTAVIVRADGETRAIEYTAQADITPGQHVWIIRDVTERKD
ncbi:MAG: ATP-binding protein [archaeon]